MMTTDTTPMPTTPPDDETFETIYNNVCSAHDGIADFRAKLLALLPIASGAGILLLVKNGADTATPHLVAVGIFGAMITIGLFFYELRGIQKCNALIELGESLEKDRGMTGRFVGRPDDVKILRVRVGATQAALIIYPAVTGAWAYLSATGVAYLVDWEGAYALLPALVFATGIFALIHWFGSVFVTKKK